MKVCAPSSLAVDMINKINQKTHGFGERLVRSDTCLGDALSVSICWVMADKVTSDTCIYVEKAKANCSLLTNTLNNEDNLP